MVMVLCILLINDGLLCYDGVEWELIKVSSSSPVRSVFVDSENNIYIGLIKDFGLSISYWH